MKAICADIEKSMELTHTEWEILEDAGYDDTCLDIDGDVVVEDEMEWDDILRILKKDGK